MVMADGAGIIVLEELEHAKARGAKIYAEIIGYGASCDASHVTAPNYAGQSRAIISALADAKLKNLPKFTFQNQTFWTANQEDERNGSFGTFNAVPTGGRWDLSAFTNLIANQWVRNPNNIYFYNSFKNRALTGEAILDSRSELMKIASMNNPNDPATLGDYIKLVKTQKFSEIYDRLKVAFTELPKSDVNRLVVLLPKYLMEISDNFAYFQTEYEKNPFTIEEQLYLKDINLEKLLSPPRVNEINLLSQLAPSNQDLLKAQANSVNTISVP